MSTFLIVGLGNPGEKYTRNRHNIGWICLDELANSLSCSFQLKSNFQTWIAQGRLGHHKVILSKPTTFMNNSGEAVQKLVAYYKVQPENILVVCDDVHILFGKARLREKGSSGGQNGIKSIIKHLGTQEFSRLKVGVGPMPNKNQMANFVLQNFPKTQWQDVPLIADQMVKGIEIFVEQDLDKAIQHCNSYTLPE